MASPCAPGFGPPEATGVGRGRASFGGEKKVPSLGRIFFCCSDEQLDGAVFRPGLLVPGRKRRWVRTTGRGVGLEVAGRVEQLRTAVSSRCGHSGLGGKRAEFFFSLAENRRNP